MACAGLLLLLGGCVSMPLRTMWDLRHFGADDAVKLKPAQLRVAVTLDPGCTVGAARLKVRFKAEHAATWNRYAFDLRPAATDPALTGQLDASEGPPTNWRLEPDDVPRFRDAQARLRALLDAKEKPGWTITAKASKIDCTPASRQPSHASIFLRLGADKAWLTLYRDARLTQKSN